MVNRALGAAVVLAGAACGSGDTDEPVGDCGPNGGCAAGFECRPTDRRCYAISNSVSGALDGLRWELPCGAMVEPVVCVTAPTQTVNATMKGTAGLTYAVKLRFRGVVETKEYLGGTNDGAFFQTGGSPISDAWNIYQLDIAQPPQTFYVNRGVTGLPYGHRDRDRREARRRHPHRFRSGEPGVFAVQPLRLAERAPLPRR